MIEQISLDWLNWSAKRKYSYGFTWLGRPIIQYPQDILAMQELIWKVRPQDMIAMQEIVWAVRPDLIIETGIAHGGSLIFSASMLQLVGGEGLVLGIDIDIRQHNRVEIEKHPLFDRIRMIEGSSIDPAIVRQVHQLAGDKSPIMVCLDSNHTHEHVLAELQAYAPLVTQGSYLVVFDTVVEDMPPDSFPDRPWGKGNNPKTAVQEFLASNDDFVIDEEIETRLQVTVAPSGYLRRVKA